MPSSKTKKGGRVTPKKIKEHPSENQNDQEGKEHFALDLEELRAVDRRKLNEAQEQSSQWEAVARSEKKVRVKLQEELQELRGEVDQLIAERSGGGSEEKQHSKVGKSKVSDKARKVRQNR